jgi:hypothetical protein
VRGGVGGGLAVGLRRRLVYVVFVGHRSILWRARIPDTSIEVSYLVLVHPVDSEFGPPAPAPSDAPPAAAPRNSRAGLVAIVALATQVVLIAGLDNQWLSQRVLHWATRSGSVTRVELAESWLTYNWRFWPRAHDDTHVLLAQLLLIATTLIMSTALIAVLVRGQVSFARAFVGTWTAVIVATQLGAFVRGLVNDSSTGEPGQSRIVRGLFGPLGPSGWTFSASAVLGVVVALVTAVVAVSTRRGRGAAAAPPPVFGDYGPPAPMGRPPVPPWQDQQFGPPPGHAAPPLYPPFPPPGAPVGPPVGAPPGPTQGAPEFATTQLPGLPAQETTALPRHAAYAPPEPAPSEPTVVLPPAPEPPAPEPPAPAATPEPAVPSEPESAEPPRTLFRTPVPPGSEPAPPAPSFPRPPDDEDLDQLDQ